MRRLIKLAVFLFLISSIIGIYNLFQDKHILNENLVRLHVVANSDSEEDQAVKLKIKDTIVEYLQPILQSIPTKEEAMQYIRENLATLEAFSNSVLERLGVQDQATVTLQPEAFSRRDYDTFSLPAGIYDALRIEIGEAEGKNWWCVVFPSLCLPATQSDMKDAAVSAGFSESLSNTITNKSGYRVRFFLLDCLGRLENLFYK